MEGKKKMSLVAAQVVLFDKLAGGWIFECNQCPEKYRDKSALSLEEILHINGISINQLIVIKVFEIIKMRQWVRDCERKYINDNI